MCCFSRNPYYCIELSTKNEQKSAAALTNFYSLVRQPLILILISLLARCAVSCQQRKMINEMEDFVTEFEENVDAITEIEDAMRQEAVNAAVEEGMMHVNFSPKAYFDGKTSTKFNIKNIENNHDDIVFEIFDEDGISIYKSKKIAPGYEMNFHSTIYRNI